MCVTSESNVVVLKLGGSVLASDSSLPAAVSEVYRHLREGRRVVAVVSAIGETTDELLGRARSVCDQADEQTLAALLATGEHTSAALLTLALQRAGVDATSRSVEQIGLVAGGARLDAEPLGLDTPALAGALERASVVVVPGFLARLADGSPATLGRGGSDLTALFIGARLGAPVTLLKDVPGLFEWDPAIPGRRPRQFSELTFDDALRLDGRIVQHKGLRFARREGVAFTVRGLNSEGGTRIGAARTALVADPAVKPPLRVGLIGLGTVGRGVADRLALTPSVAQVEAVAVREPSRHLASAPAGVQVSGDAVALAARADIDVLVDCCSDSAVSLAATRAALARGARVVTASKVLAGPHGAELASQAARCCAGIRWGAAVGGGVPVLEFAAALAAAGERVASVRGVVNGTCNFVLDRLAEGVSPGDAVRRAQQRGLAEPDPAADLSGLDSARKLIVLAREVFGVDLRLDDVDCIGIEGLTPDVVQHAAEDGRAVRLVALLERRGERLAASVRPTELPLSDPLATARNEENVFMLTVDGRAAPVVLRGLGAGRWPTTEAVVGDVLQIARERARPTVESFA
ncbi:MAG TPA: homoserine dehydrogenase [Phycisphaerales bacterium]|nr:homoserine dehydrogenase [Phycisphaerales bacterium]